MLVVSEIRAGADTSAGESAIRKRQSVLFGLASVSNQPAAVSAGRQRRVPVKARGQPVGNAALDVHAIKPWPRTIGIAGEIHQRSPIQQDGITHAPIVRRDPFTGSRRLEGCARCPICPAANLGRNR